MNSFSKATAVASILKSHRFRLEDEKKLQADIEQVLNEQKIAHTREVRLSKKDIIDFLIDDIGIEVKIGNASKLSIFRQLERYCNHPEIQHIILVTNVATGLPKLINGRSTRIINLGAAWL